MSRNDQINISISKKQEYVTLKYFPRDLTAFQRENDRFTVHLSSLLEQNRPQKKQFPPPSRVHHNQMSYMRLVLRGIEVGFEGIKKAFLQATLSELIFQSSSD